MIQIDYAGKRVIFDAVHYPKIRDVYGWSVRTNVGGYTFVAGTKGEYVNKIIARLLLSCPAGMLVDHINGNALDNRVANLRLATAQQNAFNVRCPNKGVSFDRRKNLFYSRIRTSQGRVFLGYFTTSSAAAAAYLQASIKYHGEFSSFAIKEAGDA